MRTAVIGLASIVAVFLPAYLVSQMQRVEVCSFEIEITEFDETANETFSRPFLVREFDNDTFTIVPLTAANPFK